MALAAKLWGSVESPVAKLRAYERRRREKIVELEERMVAFETALQERIMGLEAALRERMTALETALQKCPGEACLYCGERTLRLSFSSVPGGKIDEGVRRLGEVVRAARRRPAHPVERVAAPTV